MNDTIWDPEVEDLTDILERVQPDLHPHEESSNKTHNITPQRPQPLLSRRIDPALSILLHNTRIPRNIYHDHHFALTSRSASPASDMSAAPAPPQAAPAAAASAPAHIDGESVAIDPSLSVVDNGRSQALIDPPALATRFRSDSDHTKAIDPQLSQAADVADTSKPEKLTLQVTADTAATRAPEQQSASLELSRQSSNGQTLDTLRPLDPVSPSIEGSVASPARERLPSISQLTQQLTTHSLPALAEAATQQEARSQSYPQHHQQHHHHHHHSLSYSSNPPQSPILNHHQQSPVAFPAFQAGITTRSPTAATNSDTPYYQSPQTYGQPYAFYGHRRTSAAADHAGILPPSLPSASSSGDSLGPTGSSMDGYSTSQTTPVDPAQSNDTTPRANSGMLPPPGGFKCPYEGCTAQPFQTQYLLTSHKNVHSQDRPHFCPVQDCPRGEGGKGFKRKNEMIRHGLVHKSPGYICPFCPEREHKYPRPDNLQRHVRVHHVDKDRDDPALQEVLNQRTEGQGKTRRRRTTMTTSGSA